MSPSILFAIVLLALAMPGRAATARVAVAANFTVPARVIAAAFARATGHEALLSFGASGVFLTQIEHGAPFDVFLSADADRPRRAEADGFAAPGSRFTYAVGRLVLYSTTPGLIADGGAVLATGRFAHLAIADPAVAPYGRAAVEVMRRLGIDRALAPRLVRGASVAQAYQFVASGAAELGFVAAAQVATVRGGSRWAVPARLHAPIDQQAVVLRRGAGNPAAAAFARFLKGAEARAIIIAHGYDPGGA